MYVVSGIPISRGIGVDELSYYTVREVAPGALVTAPIRGTLRPLLVTKVAPVSNMKARLRAQSFELQKLGPNPPVTVLFPEVLEALGLAQQETLVHRGALLYTCVPDFVLTEASPISSTHSTTSSFAEIPIQAPFEDRISMYKNIIRENFARGESVYVLVPTRFDVLRISEKLGQGIAQYITPLHGHLSEKVARARWQDAVTSEHPVVIVATATYLSIPRRDLGTIICERVSDNSYTRIDSPHVDMRIVAESIARALRILFVIGDTLLPASIHARIQTHVVDTPLPLTVKAKGGPLHLVHYKKNEAPLKTDAEKSMRLLDESLYIRMMQVLSGGGTVVVVAPRKGIATTVLCNDCGTRSTCHVCGRGLRLHTKQVKKSPAPSQDADAAAHDRVLACTNCGHQESASTTCTTCGSWKLVSLGIADEGLYNEISTVLTTVRVELLDTNKKAPPQSKGASITICTAKALHGLTPTLTLFPSLESMLSVPSIDADIDTARSLALSREVSSEVYVQTRTNHIDARTQNIIDGNLAEVVRSDLLVRATLHVPPYIRLVSVRCEGSKQRVIADARVVIDTLKKYKPKPHPELVRESATTLSHTTTLSFPGPFPEDLLTRVQSLPTGCSISVS